MSLKYETASEPLHISVRYLPDISLLSCSQLRPHGTAIDNLTRYLRLTKLKIRANMPL